MKLLFDQHLSPHLAAKVADLFPHSSHVVFVGLDCAADEAIWRYAGANGFAIVTKDPDFADLAVVHGFPPEVVWLRLGNCTTRQVEAAIRAYRDEIAALANDPVAGVIEVSRLLRPDSGS